MKPEDFDREAARNSLPPVPTPEKMGHGAYMSELSRHYEAHKEWGQKNADIETRFWTQALKSVGMDKKSTAVQDWLRTESKQTAGSGRYTDQYEAFKRSVVRFREHEGQMDAWRARQEKAQREADSMKNGKEVRFYGCER